MFLKKVNTFIFIFTIFSVINKLSTEEILFDNFNNKEKQSWEFISDQVMGGVSFGEFKIISENKENFLRLTGQVSIENNGGFIQVRKNIISDKYKNIKGIGLKFRGNNTDYFIHIRTRFTLLPWQYYQAKYYATNNWAEIKFDFTDFTRSGGLLPKKINPKYITSFAIVAFGKKHEVHLDVSEIVFY